MARILLIDDDDETNLDLIGRLPCLQRATIRDTALLDRCRSPSSGFSAVRMRRLWANYGTHFV